MKKNICPSIYIYTTILFFCMSTLAFAQTSTTTPIRRGQTLHQEEQQEMPSERIVERRNALLIQAQERIINLVSNVTIRCTAAIHRMENIISRFETRIEKLHALGVTTDTISAKLAEANVSLEKARVVLAKIPSIEGAIRSDTPHESFAIIRTDFQLIHTLLKETHATLRETLTLSKEAATNIVPDRTIDSPITAQGADSGNGSNSATSTVH